MLEIGAQAPRFESEATDGGRVGLAGLRGQPVVLYFFHKAFTPNCIAETKGFRDNYPELKELGLEVIGVSTDSHETQCRFSSTFQVSYPMIGDPKLQIARDYRVLWPLIPFARRVAYVLDARHRVAARFRHEFQVSRHLDEIMHFARAEGAALRAA